MAPSSSGSGGLTLSVGAVLADHRGLSAIISVGERCREVR
jgi:hypothetical protein